MTGNDSGGKDSFACEECGDTFGTERGRDSHVEQVHGRPYHDEGLLRKLYVERGLSTMDIADRYGVTYKAITGQLRRHGIEVRSTAESHVRKTPEQLRDEETLRELYVEQDLRDAQIAELLDVGQPTVTKWRNVHGIEPRPNPSGEDHYAWNPDAEQIDYGDNWPEMRRKARERDGNTCQRCGFEPDGGHLDVHHIRPVKRFDVPEDANTFDNLITVCRSCHRKIEGIMIDTSGL